MSPERPVGFGVRDFEKAEGLGNDFVLLRIEEPESCEPPSAEVAAWCDRRRGVGADGLVAIGPVRGGRVRVRFWNADGSLAGNCGNALRCVLVHLGRRGEVAVGEPLRVEADGGSVEARLLRLAGAEGWVRVRMPRARFEPGAVPVRAAGPLRGARWEAAGMPVRLTALSVGNPHAVLLEPELPEARWEVLARALGQDVRFPEGANVGFVRVLGPGRVRLRVWERGVGWTEACGTGACAAVAALVAAGEADPERPVRVELPGGTLRITQARDGALWMEGPARLLFTGRRASSSERDVSSEAG